MKVLVTGGAGYIGSIAVEQLVKAGEDVVVFDNLFQGHQQAVHPKAAFVQGDLANRAAICSVAIEQSRSARSSRTTSWASAMLVVVEISVGRPTSRWAVASRPSLRRRQAALSRSRLHRESCS